MHPHLRVLLPQLPHHLLLQDGPQIHSNFRERWHNKRQQKSTILPKGPQRLLHLLLRLQHRELLPVSLHHSSIRSKQVLETIQLDAERPDHRGAADLHVLRNALPALSLHQLPQLQAVKGTNEQVVEQRWHVVSEGGFAVRSERLGWRGDVAAQLGHGVARG